MMEILTLIGEIVKQILELFHVFAPDQDTTFDEIETQVRSVMLEIGRQIVEAIIKVRGTGYSGKRTKTPSGDMSTYREDRTRTVKTLMGPVKVIRAYYHMGKGSGGYFPLDESLSLPHEQYSYAVQEQMSLHAIDKSYGESSRKLCYTFPIEASASTVRRISQKYGKEILQSEQSRVEAIFNHKQEVPEPEIQSVERGYTGTDGVMVPTVDGYKEMKVITTYDTSFAKETIAHNLYYHALFAEPDILGEHLWVMLKERGICDAAESTWCCDGAKWIWRQKGLHDPEGKEIVDFIHASEYLEKVANAVYGSGTDKSSKCWSCMKTRLRKCGGKPVLDALRKLSETHTSEELDSALTYFQNNHHRMDYPAYEAEGYHITSSTTESACRHVVGDRLKGSGMRWTIQGAQYTTLLRLKWKNHKWEDFWMKYRRSLAA
jgi:hypothetical protein